MKSYVYFIRAGERKNAPIKIGKSNDPDTRLIELQTGNPYKLEIVFLFECETERRAYKIEYYLHHKLKRFRLEGEWFKPNDWHLKTLLDKYKERMDFSIGDFKQVETKLQKLKRQNKELKSKIKELEDQIEDSLDREMLLRI